MAKRLNGKHQRNLPTKDSEQEIKHNLSVSAAEGNQWLIASFCKLFKIKIPGMTRRKDRGTFFVQAQ